MRRVRPSFIAPLAPSLRTTDLIGDLECDAPSAPSRSLALLGSYTGRSGKRSSLARMKTRQSNFAAAPDVWPNEFARAGNDKLSMSREDDALVPVAFHGQTACQGRE